MDESDIETCYQTTSERISEMTIIDGDGLAKAITDTLKGHAPSEPVEVPEDLAAAWSDLTTEEQAAYRRSAEIWWPPETPEKLPGETRATHALRTEQAEQDRQKMLNRDQVKAFRKARQPSKLQGLVDAMATGSEERNAARAKAEEEKALEQKQIQANQRQIARREGGGGLDGGWSQV